MFFHVHHLPQGDDPSWPSICFFGNGFWNPPTSVPTRGEENSAIHRHILLITWIFLRAEKNATTESIQKKLDEALAAKAQVGLARWGFCWWISRDVFPQMERAITLGDRMLVWDLKKTLLPHIWPSHLLSFKTMFSLWFSLQGKS